MADSDIRADAEVHAHTDADAPVDRDRVKSIYLSIDKLIKEQKTQRTQGKHKQLTPSIYRVPKILRNVNELSYNPRVLSIGPFHKKDENLKRLEANKVSYVRNLFRRLNSPREVAMKECIAKVLNRIDQIKSCYEGGIKDYQNNQLADDDNNNNNKPNPRHGENNQLADDDDNNNNNNNNNNNKPNPRHGENNQLADDDDDNNNNNNNKPNPAGAGYEKNNQLADNNNSNNTNTNSNSNSNSNNKSSNNNNNNNKPNPTEAGYRENNQLAEMMVIDGCFILEVIYASYTKYVSHSFFDINSVSLYVKHDLVLLENQIPFFVLQDLFGCTISSIEPNLLLVKLVLEFLEDINPFSEKKLVDNIPSADTHHDHILGLLQKCYQPMDAEETSQERLRESKLTAMSYSAADLSRAGVKFAPNKNKKSILTMEFKVPRLSFHCFSMGKPTFFMPVLTIEDYTESFFRNLIVYEQLTPATSKHITSYGFAMDCLLDSQEDVQKVIGSKVFVNNLGSTKEASDLFNNICKEVTVKDFSYESQWKEVNKYYKGYWPKNVAFLRRTYFSNPWSLIGLLAATLLFALTVAQTYFTIYHPS